jgi:hypothetical protein
LPGTYAAATTSSANSGVSPIAANLSLAMQATSASTLTYNVSGTVTGTYALNLSYGDLGVGTIALTAPSAKNYAIYVLDTLGCTGTIQNPNPVCAVQSFFMMDETTTPNPDTNASIIFAQE